MLSTGVRRQATTATLTLPNGSQIALQRFTF
jgi:hypothetical protein